ncbi:MAG: hypothetical protein K8R88_10060 [Armatimonadetes bacterium]|nr:hypothetical protein [Armatimonadota bacterium]
MDDNHELYLLLRASNWNKREKVVGKLGAALWVRHIAEVLRHAYDEIYEDRLVHEDEAFGHWYDGARTWAYGSAYPLEDIPEMRRRILPHWGMVSSPRVRFYVEGDTEEGALAYALAGLLGFGLELVNLKAQGWGTWLRQELKNDQAAKRISLFMLDNDREDDTRALKAHVRAKLVVGVIFKNSPDLETGCFQIDELLKATVYFEESIGVQDLEPLDPDDFRDINSGRKFEEQYCKIRRAPSLKGKLWGEALMRVAFESGKGEENRLVHAYACAVRGVSADYEVQRVRHPLNPETFENDSVNAEGFP